MRRNILLVTLVAVTLFAAYPGLGKNGFDLKNSSIPEDKILQGGPPRDGIPAIDQPKFITAEEADFLNPDSRLIGVFLEGKARAYPIGILNWHEIVNDRISGKPVLVTFCPLCGTGMVFRPPGKSTYGVSGLLYNSDVLLYDRATESLWSQIKKVAVSGPRKGEQLELLPASHTTWADWRGRHPDSAVLSTDTGFNRDYSKNPYRDYAQQRKLYFPVSNRDTRYHPKEVVIGIDFKGHVKAWPFVELSKAAEPIKDNFAGRAVTVFFDAESRTGRVLDGDGEEIPSTLVFWFAWAAFHPETEVYKTP